MEQKMTFLGTYTAVSKKTNNPYWQSFFYSETPNVIGYRSHSFFVDQELYNKLRSLKPLTDVNCNVYFVNGTNVLLSVEEVK